MNSKRLPIVTKRKRHSNSGWVVLLLLLTVLQACRDSPKNEDVTPQIKTADQYSNEVALKWSAMQLRLIRQSPGFTPPVASRALGYGGITMYESVVPGLPNKQSLVGQLQGLTSLPKAVAGNTYNWALSANAAQAAILRNLHANAKAEGKAAIDSLETALYNTFKEIDVAVNDRSVKFGQDIAKAIFEWSKTDGGHEGYTRNFPSTFTVPVFVGAWQPTENGQKIPMQPTWGNNRTFLKVNAELPIPQPIAVSSSITSQYFAQYLEVYTKNVALTQEEKEISVWWADDPSETFTPPGHSYSLARIAVRDGKAGLGKAAETFARVGISVADAFVCCWRVKFAHFNERPYTFVRRAIDPSWIPFWPAPPFPGFSSGHATQSAATAIVLSDLYGSSFRFTDDSHIGRIKDTKRNVDFKARTFNSFWESAEESALSRFLGGIHTRQDNEVGLREGRKIGQNVNAIQWNK